MVPSLFNGSVTASACSAATISYPSLFGADFLSLEANVVANYSQRVPIGFYSNHGSVNAENINFCNVTVSYTHPGQGDKINVQVWMPSGDAWNGRLQAIGGAGFQAGLHYAGLMSMTSALAEGYATVGTDAGLGNAFSVADWGLLSEGNSNLYLLQNMASVSLNDAAVISKSIINSFYGQLPTYSYFNGCSQGGRQGMMIAQRYPDAYDGIASSAPAINWNQLLISGLWPSFLMDSLQTFPPRCEINAFTEAAIQACDGIDGVLDGIINEPELCDFDPKTIVGKLINCIDVGGEWWSGAKRQNNSPLWVGVSKDAVLTGSVTDTAIIPTTCTSDGNCTRTTFQLSGDWVPYMVLKNSTSSLDNLTHQEFDRIAHLGVQLYESMVGTNDPDLSAFRDRGGKIVGYHGTTDTIIPPGGSLKYYDNVMALDTNVQDYYRMFLAPGLNHCFGGPGAYPHTTFDAMREWVEYGTVPDSLAAASVGTSTIIKRHLCPYPKKQRYDGVGNTTAGEGFDCV